MASTRSLDERIREFAEELSREFGGVEEREGECLMSRVEDFAGQIGDAVASRLIEQEVSSRERDDDRQCPGCGKPGHFKQRRTRTVQTKRGEITIAEPEFYCGRCRRSFFPSVQETGDDARL